MSFRKFETEIHLTDNIVKGNLTIIDGVWSFRSDDAAFRSVFPAGSLSSFDHFKKEEDQRATIQDMIRDKASDFITHS